MRVLATSNRHLREEVAAGRFREDLFYRLNVIAIKVPPLRERKGDLQTLAQHFLDVFKKETGLANLTISDAAMEKMGRPFCTATTRRVVKLRPSRMQSTV